MLVKNNICIQTFKIQPCMWCWCVCWFINDIDLWFQGQCQI